MLRPHGGDGQLVPTHVFDRWFRGGDHLWGPDRESCFCRAMGSVLPSYWSQAVREKAVFSVVVGAARTLNQSRLHYPASLYRIEPASPAKDAMNFHYMGHQCLDQTE